MVKKMTIEQLAVMIQNTMASKEDLKPLATKKDLHALDEKVGMLEQKMDVSFQHVNTRLDTIRNDISDLPAMRGELHDLHRRAERLEHKSGRGR